MDINIVKQARNRSEATEYAIEWQNWVVEQNLSYGEMADWNLVFEGLALKYGLKDELIANGIIGEIEEIKLTDEQISRQDFVDGQIFKMIENVLGSNIDWDINPITEIRDIVMKYYVPDEEEMEFYPYIEIKGE